MTPLVYHLPKAAGVPSPTDDLGYLVHQGQATLAAVARAGETTNRYYAWAVGHQKPQFGLHPYGAALAAAMLRWLAGRLPADALRPGPVAPPQAAVR